MHNINKISLYIITPLVLLAGSLFFAPQAQAKIVAVGNREFTDDVNNCFNTYRNSPGVVGDVIRELENSSNEHRVINNSDWTNTVNNNDNAFNGKGTGTVTRVNKEALEKYKKDFVSLANKDFCTALLHEMWHAVDADRGEWTSDEVGGVKRNEIEAVMFQNFIHGIRGVAPRILYSGVDISEFVVIGQDVPAKEVKETAPEPKKEIRVAADYKHVAPGKYSEVYLTVTVSPGADVQAKLSGPGVSSEASQTIKAGSDGVAKFTWRIVSYGKYTVTGTAGGEKFSSEINVK